MSRNYLFVFPYFKSEKCLQTLKKVGLEKQAGSLTAELSYGDKRMLEIAIALSIKPKLLLLDEPLSGLSDHEITEVIELLKEVKKDLTLVIIEHKISKITDLKALTAYTRSALDFGATIEPPGLGSPNGKKARSPLASTLSPLLLDTNQPPPLRSS